MYFVMAAIRSGTSRTSTVPATWLIEYTPEGDTSFCRLDSMSAQMLPWVVCEASALAVSSDWPCSPPEDDEFESPPMVALLTDSPWTVAMRKTLVLYLKKLTFPLFSSKSQLELVAVAMTSSRPFTGPL